MKHSVPHHSSRPLLLAAILSLLPFAAAQAQGYYPDFNRPGSAASSQPTSPGSEDATAVTPSGTMSPGESETGPGYEAQVPPPRGARGPVRSESTTSSENEKWNAEQNDIKKRLGIFGETKD